MTDRKTPTAAVAAEATARRGVGRCQAAGRSGIRAEVLEWAERAWRLNPPKPLNATQDEAIVTLLGLNGHSLKGLPEIASSRSGRAATSSARSRREPKDECAPS